MKKIVSLHLIILLATTAAFAQPGNDGQNDRKRPSMEQMVEHTMEKLNKEIELNSDQKTKLTAILTDFHKEIQGKRSEGKEAMDAVVSSRDKKVKAILSADQLKVFQKTMLDMRPKGKGGMQGGRGEQGRPRQ